MREIYEFRIPEGWASEWLELGDGKKTRNGSVRVVTAAKNSELFARVLSADAEKRKVNERLFLSWCVRREYDAEEIEAADLFLLNIFNVFEPAAEEFGTVYLPEIDGPAESTNRVGPLVLQCSRFRGRSFCQSIAGEKIVSPEMQMFIRKEGFTGVEFGPVLCKGRDASNPGWAELIVKSPKVSISPKTLIGVDPLELGPRGGAGAGENIGLNLLSEVSVERETWDGSDFAASRQTLGLHQGFLRPHRLLFISKRVLQALVPRMRRGLSFEIVRFT